MAAFLNGLASFEWRPGNFDSFAPQRTEKTNAELSPLQFFDQLLQVGAPGYFVVKFLQLSFGLIELALLCVKFLLKLARQLPLIAALRIARLARSILREPIVFALPAI